MRTVRLVILAVLLVILMVLMAANWNPIDLQLAPPQLMPGLPVLVGVPLALVIVAALLAGIVIGLLMEFIREAKDRRKLSEKRRQVNELRDENARLTKRLQAHGDEIGALTS